MAGVAGRSGRKSWDKEHDGKALWDLSVPVLRGYLTSHQVKADDKVVVALELFKKMMPAQLKVNGNGTGETHYHYTTINVDAKPEELVSDILAELSRRPSVSAS